MSRTVSDEARTDAPGPKPTSARDRLRRALAWGAGRRTPVVVVPLLVALVAVGATGARMLTAAIPEATGTQPWTCWDGSGAESPDECSVPTGQAGLGWVFPSFHPERDPCRDVLLESPENKRPTQWACDVRVEGAPVRIDYIELTDVAKGLEFLERTYDGYQRQEVLDGSGEVYRYVWRKPTARGFELVTAYVDYPFAVQVSSELSHVRERAHKRLRFRDPAELRAEPTF